MKSQINIAVLGVVFCSSLIVSAGTSTRPVVAEQRQVEAARGVMERLVPGIGKNFVLEILPKEDGLDVFELEMRAGKIVLRGSTGVALCSGFNWYLKQYCHCHVSWCGDQLDIPSPLPPVPEKVRKVSPNKYRVYLNYCDFSYTMPWWDWTRWQREIDWMALNGINMPLAATGLEGTWFHTLRKFKMTDEEIREFLAGPSFMAWQWMTNLEGYGGPLSQSWIDSHIELGRQILEQERALGMTPIQQGFTGFVPRKLMEKYPEARIDQEHGWAHGTFEGTCQLDPTDPLFAELAETFYRTQAELFGTSHHYGADPFHEGKPPQEGDEYLKKVADSILAAMLKVDPQAKWVMQSWSLRKGIATAVPKDRLLILDLNGGKVRHFKGFWDYEFVRGTLNNFGGRHGLIGKQNMYEHSVRAPFMAVGPGIEPGMKIDTPIYLQDVMPTSLELAGRPIPDYVEFKSLLPLLKGEKKHYPAMYGSYQNQQRMVSKDGWKLIYYPSIQKARLYHLEDDPFEKTELAGNPEYAGKIAELEKALAQLCTQYNDPLDFDNPKESWNAYREAAGMNKKRKQRK